MAKKDFIVVSKVIKPITLNPKDETLNEMEHIIKFNQLDYLQNHYPGEQIDKNGVCLGLAAYFLFLPWEDVAIKLEQG